MILFILNVLYLMYVFSVCMLFVDVMDQECGIQTSQLHECVMF